MESIWEKGIKRPEFKELNRDIKTDVLIIGGGIAGILCAYMLDEAGVDYALVEADRLCSGITKNTTAKISCQHGLIYSEMLDRFGTELTALYLKSQMEALGIYREMSKKIQCDFEECDSFVYSTKNRAKLEKEKEALEKIGCRAVLEEKTELPFSVKGAVGIKGQAQFHPLKFALGVAEKLNVFEKTKVLELRPDATITTAGKIKAEKIIVATHFPFINKHGSYFLKMYQNRSYAIALKNAPKINGMYVDEDEKGMSFRIYEDYLIIGGGSHRTGKNGGNWNELSEFSKENYPQAIEVCRWATQDCMTLDKIPYIGQYSKRTPSLYVATGFNKWGMTSAMVAAMVLKELVQGKRSEYEDVYSPSRSILRPQLAVNAIEAMGGLITPVKPRCPHMGCALKYNRQEHSWDCSCHGSRFDENGQVIDNPASDDIKANKLNR